MKTINEYLEQKRVDALQNLYNEVCEVEQSIFDITRPFYDNILKDKLKYIFTSSVSNSYDKLILISKQMLFFQISDKVKFDLGEVRKYVSEFLDTVDELDDELSTKKPDKDIVSIRARNVADQISYGGFDQIISKIKTSIKEDIKGIS